jgi:transcription initiation factor IIF auxiliary subunit
VVYFLHKSFNPRVVTIRKRDRNQTYKLSRSGWGESNILVHVYLGNSKTPISINHPLKLR